jgi:hypothetical protein
MTSHAKSRARTRRTAALGRGVDLPLPTDLRRHPELLGSVALVSVAGDHLRLRFLKESILPRGSGLSAGEEAILEEGGVRRLTEPEAHLAAGQAIAAYEGLRAGGLSVDGAARRLGVNPSRIRQRLLEGSLLGLKEGRGWLLPGFQFLERGTVPGLGRVLRRLPRDIGALAVARWFSHPNPDLAAGGDERPLTPLEWLLGGHPPEKAAELAAAL